MEAKIDEAKITYWIQQSIGTTNFTIEIDEGTTQGEGYIGDFLFVKVIFDTSNTDNRNLHLAIKMNKNNPDPSNKLQFNNEACKRERLFYEKIIPAFNNFQKLKNIKNPFTAIPKCYKTFSDNNAIIMDNVKHLGYELHKRELPLNVEHLRLSLETFAKLHALSLAMRDQNKDSFENITNDFRRNDQFKFIKSIIDLKSPTVLKNLQDMGRFDLSTEYEKMLEKGIYNIIQEIIDDVPKEKVMVHSDCHNANFLFKYEDADKQTPSSMVLIDFQTSILHSPIIDVAYFVYANMSKDELQHLDELLDHYYNELSSFVIQLGSDPNELFPKSAFRSHWKKYAGFGFHIMSLFMELLYIVKEEAPVIDETADDNIFKKFSNVKLRSKDQYLKRLEDTVEHFLSYNIS